MPMSEYAEALLTPNANFLYCIPFNFPVEQDLSHSHTKSDVTDHGLTNSTAAFILRGEECNHEMVKIKKKMMVDMCAECKTSALNTAEH